MRIVRLLLLVTSLWFAAGRVCLAQGDPCRATVFGFAVNGKSMIAICCSQEPVQETAAAFDKIRASFLPLK